MIEEAERKSETQCKKAREMEAETVSRRNASVVKQSEVQRAKGGQIAYQHEVLGKDHTRDVAARKEEERERRRTTIRQQLESVSEKQKSVARELQTPSRSTLEVPSFKAKPSRKLEYKKLLLQQIELDHERRRLSKQYEQVHTAHEFVTQPSCPSVGQAVPNKQALRQHQATLVQAKENAKVRFCGPILF
jgi:hypothetical protein